MKEFERQKTDTPPDAPTVEVKSKRRGHSAGVDAAHATSEADLIHARELSHPANVAPLADVLNQLQHSHGNSYVQRVVADMKQADSGPESQSTDRSQALDGGIKSEMESAFGENFGDVRVHIGSEAEGLNDQLGARAVTRGRDIYFGTGEYDPSTPEGKHLVAHELAHVIQQGGGSHEQANAVGQAGDEFEQEADRAADTVLSGHQVHIPGSATAPALQRDPRRQQQILHMGPIKLEFGLNFFFFHGFISEVFFSRPVRGSEVDTLQMTLEAGVTVSVVDRSGTGLNSQDPGGTRRRALTITVNPDSGAPRQIELTLTRGSDTWVVVLECPRSYAPNTGTRGRH